MYICIVSISYYKNKHTLYNKDYTLYIQGYILVVPMKVHVYYCYIVDVYNIDIRANTVDVHMNIDVPRLCSNLADLNK